MRLRTPRMKQSVGVRFVLLSMAFVCSSAAAHEGPPFPLLMDEPLAGQKVSIWADPDIGEAKFFIVVQTPGGGMPEEVPTVSMWTEPTSGRLERVTYRAELRTQRNHLLYEVRPTFDVRDMWQIGFGLTMPGGEPQWVITEVESTPPGFGMWDLAIYLFPFILMAGMWGLAMRRRRAAWREHLLESEPVTTSHESGVDGSSTQGERNE